MSHKLKKAERELIDAVLMDDLPKARSLLDAGISIGVRDPEHEENLLMLARSEPMTRLLLERGADANAKDNRGYNPLVFGKCFTLLLEAGADPNSRDICGETPLFLAIALADFDKVDALIAHGADVNVLNDSGQGPLEEAHNHGLLHLAQVLKAAGATG